MLKKFLLTSFLLLSINLIFIKPVHAQNEFSTSYLASYEVDNSGSTTVTEQISLKNLTDRFYASSFGLTIGATQITDVLAFDNQGALDTSVEKQGNKTKISVKFPSQITGKDKTYSWTLKFRSSDFAQQQGKIWQVTIPKIASIEGVENYDLTLSIPVEFGDPTSILPEPKKQSEEYGKINLKFTKDQLSGTGILANFGTNQQFKFKLRFHLTNNSAFPSAVIVPLPPDTNFQQVLIGSISPKPENVTIDPDGNYLANFKLERNQDLDVEIVGQAKLFISSREKPILPLSKKNEEVETSARKYWEKDNPLIQTKLSEIFKSGEPPTVKEKARLINSYVSENLKYDSVRLQKGDFSRLGAVTALNNPTSALCEEYTDLFIALSRAAGISTRELDGFAYAHNTDLRPLSFNGTILHAWPEYYDPGVGWLMIDPTWQATTGGVDYFSKFDLNHLVLNIRGGSSENPSTASSVKVDFSDIEFNPSPNLSLTLNAPREIFAGFPAQANLSVANVGSGVSTPSLINISSYNLDVTPKSFNLPAIAPFGKIDYSSNLRTQRFWSSFDTSIQVVAADREISKHISIRPFFAFKFFPAILIGIGLGMIGLYMLSLFLHINKHRRK